MNGRFEIRELETGGPIELRGHAATFDDPYEVGSFTETIRPGSFRRTLGEQPDVSLLVNHTGTPLARTTSGTMTLREDSVGLAFTAQLEPSDPDVQALVPKLRRGDLSEASFAFRATRQSWSEDKTERTLREVAIHRGDVSIVTTAANPSATASLRGRELSLEQREAVAQRVGNRVCGPYSADTLSAGWKYEDGRLLVPAGATARAAPPVRSYMNTARAKRAKLRRGERRADASESPFGERWNIGTTSDVESAIRNVALGRAKGPREGAIKDWIRARARALGASALIPRSWGTFSSGRGRRAHGTDASVEGAEDKPRYTEAQVTALGKEGRAFRKKDGSYSYPVADRRDLLNAIQAFGRAKPSEASALKAWLKTRARVMQLESLLPESWQSKARPTPARARTRAVEPDADDCPDCGGTGECQACEGSGRTTEMTGADAVSGVGGQQQ